MDTTMLKGKWALVTGASSGLGVDFAKQLAAIGCHLLLVARREDRLRTVAADIMAQYGVQVEIITLDLSLPEAPQQLYDQLQTAGKQVDVLINNAGYGLYGEFDQLDWQRQQNMLQLDIMTLTHLTKLFIKDMIARNSGYILQVASIGGYQPSPLYATYSAAKSFVLSFSEAVNYELRNTGVKLTVVSPGVTKTEFLVVSGQQPTLYQRLSMMQSTDVVRIALNALWHGQPSVIPGFMNALTIFLSTRLMPRWMSIRLAYATMQSN